MFKSLQNFARKEEHKDYPSIWDQIRDLALLVSTKIKIHDRTMKTGFSEPSSWNSIFIIIWSNRINGPKDENHIQFHFDDNPFDKSGFELQKMDTEMKFLTSESHTTRL